MLKKLGILLLGAGCAWAAQAKVDEVQAARLDQDLTPLGAERAGNADGSIPPWTGGITQAPAGYRPGMHHLDPFAADRPRLVLDSRNMAAYQALLTPGTQALLQANPDYHLRVFPTRRSASLPQRLYDATRANASRAELIADGNGVQGAAAGVPFPLPQSGQEAIWNHIMRYRGEQLHLQTNQAAVLANGSYNLLKLDRYLYFVYGREGMIPENLENTLFYYKYKVVAPARLAGSALVVQETLDQVLSIRKAWRFNRGERRVRRLPTLAYDSLQPDTNGMATADTVDVYNGAPDHYEWALLGKREMLVPYNSYAVHQKGLAYGDILKSRFINPDLLRYELHRVWVVEATLRKGFSHPYAKRRFYLDEDSWQILAADIYDKDGVLTRAQEVHPINYYDVPLVSSTLEAIYDFKGGRYFVDGLDNNEPMYDFGVQVGPRDFTPQALRREGN
ncbi:DUF1329 domain-containing protein [Pseudomonas aeruginosa]|nr:DUF1329 domain-containing protein [Pseudomonas aeruginosa]MBG7080680.1 DUF1329 domain-containing protein [Pseudomonas aeruginosa]